jgi:DNA primase
MESNNAARQEIQRPPILQVIEQHVTLRKSGRDYWGLCPFHAEKTPSFAVNVEKEVFYCHGACASGGDVFTFIQKIEGVDFKTAARRLGVETYRPSPAQLQIKREAKTIAKWVAETSSKLCDALREIGDQIRVCRLTRAQSGADRDLVQHEAGLIRQWALLTDLDDDLNNPKLALELWQQRADVDRLMESLA